ncbi:MAG: hypothetical protein BRC23_02480 [Parcubacteria group bacterium SW_4_49_11]|nr:MAG: hypothetical protein BRC23_02480 [Parcubacteria group bacterium SW_4_49_11]
MKTFYRHLKQTMNVPLVIVVTVISVLAVGWGVVVGAAWGEKIQTAREREEQRLTYNDLLPDGGELTRGRTVHGEFDTLNQNWIYMKLATTGKRVPVYVGEETPVAKLTARDPQTVREEYLQFERQLQQEESRPTPPDTFEREENYSLSQASQGMRLRVTPKGDPLGKRAIEARAVEVITNPAQARRIEQLRKQPLDATDEASSSSNPEL